MNAIADRYADHGVGSVFVYTHEAHPGEHYPHLTSLEQKFRHARALRDVLKVARPILVDALDGACHRAYGSMPNMTWIFSRAGIPVYKSDWTDAHSVENAVQYSGELGLDQQRFTQCMVSQEHRQTVAQSGMQAISLGLNSTPSILVNGRRMENPFDYDALSAEIERLLAAAGE